MNELFVQVARLRRLIQGYLMSKYNMTRLPAYMKA